MTIFTYFVTDPAGELKFCENVHHPPQYRILQSNQLNYREIGVALARVSRIAETME
jgi:hypothetical protein